MEEPENSDYKNQVLKKVVILGDVYVGKTSIALRLFILFKKLSDFIKVR